MADDAPATPPAETPALTAEEQAAAKAARIAKGRANLLPPAQKGEVRNPTGKNGRTQHAALVKWLEQPSTDPEMSRIERVWQATYLAALKGSSVDRKTLVEQHGGKPRQQLDLSSEDGSMSPAKADAVAATAIAILEAQKEPEPDDGDPNG